jgi:hypothetical protein
MEKTTAPLGGKTTSVTEWLKSDSGKAAMANARKERKAYYAENPGAKENDDYAKAQRKEIREAKKEKKREIDILKFMKKTKVEHHHHGTTELIKELDILCAIASAEEGQLATYDYDAVTRSVPMCQLGNLWNHEDFQSIYNVPLDGSYRFIVYDSGHRGCGARDYITAVSVTEKPKIPEVNPGGFPPITAPKY